MTHAFPRDTPLKEIPPVIGLRDKQQQQQQQQLLFESSSSSSLVVVVECAYFLFLDHHTWLLWLLWLLDSSIVWDLTGMKKLFSYVSTRVSLGGTGNGNASLNSSFTFGGRGDAVSSSSLSSFSHANDHDDGDTAFNRVQLIPIHNDILCMFVLVCCVSHTAANCLFVFHLLLFVCL